MIRPEAALIKVLLELEVYNKYRSYIVIKDDKELQTLYSFLDKLMEKYQRDLTFDEYAITVLSNVQHEKLVIQHLLDVIREASVDKEVAEELLIQSKERNLAHNIALLAIEVTEGKKQYVELHDCIASNSDIKQEMQDEHLFITDDLETLHADFVERQGLRWRLHTLNRMLGSLRRGNFGFVFARPETGKTTFLASE